MTRPRELFDPAACEVLVTYQPAEDARPTTRRDPPPGAPWLAGASTDRADLEALVRQVYATAYGADIDAFLPVLVGIRSGGEAIGAIGARPALGARLFLETYLDETVDHAMSRHLGRRIDRSTVHEVGNLAAARPGVGLHLVTAMASWLHSRHVPWVVFTATRALRNGLRKAGVELIELEPARKERVPGGGDNWGLYYETAPHVCVASIPQVGAAVTGGPRATTLAPLWNAVDALCARELAS